MKTKNTLPTTTVDAPAVRRGHIIPVDGLIAIVTSKPERRSNKLIITWEQVDHSPGDTPIRGTLPVRADGTVECIPVSGWRDAMQERGVVNG